MLSSEWKEFFGDTEVIIRSQTEKVVHKLTHQNLHTYFIHIVTDLDYFQNSDKYQLIRIEDGKNYPFPKLIENHLSNRIN